MIAHETGHIAGGHLVRLQRELQDAQIKQIIATILAAGAGIATRQPGVVIAGFIMCFVTFGFGLLNVPGIVMSIFVGLLLILVIAAPILYRRFKSG